MSKINSRVKRTQYKGDNTKKNKKGEREGGKKKKKERRGKTVIPKIRQMKDHRNPARLLKAWSDPSVKARYLVARSIKADPPAVTVIRRFSATILRVCNHTSWLLENLPGGLCARKNGYNELDGPSIDRRAHPVWSRFKANSAGVLKKH